jgi:Neuraminidase (sialidase)
MNHWGITRRAVGLAVLIAAVAAGTASAASPAANQTVDTSWCANPLLSQPFASSNDSNWYTLMPGELADSFTGTGWQLTGGAKIVKTTLADGSVSSVLDLPSGSTAVSPAMCVTAAYPTARAMVRDIVGSEGVFFYVGYEGTNTWTNPRNTGQVHGQHTAWTLSDSVNVQPDSNPGWQPVRFTLEAGGKTSDFQVYDFYIDPHSMH